MRIVVVTTGGREFADRALVYRVLGALRPTRVAQGGASGADALVRDWCAEHAIECETYAANWDRYGRAAGPIRNEGMMLAEQPDLVVAFKGGPGTANCKSQAVALGIPILEVA